jgi:hypothetical protein
MIAYAFLEEDEPPKHLEKIQKQIPKEIQQESECNVILFMFICGVIALSLVDSRK